MAEKKATQKVTIPTVKDLLEAGAHFGHEVKRWNPRFGAFVYTKRGDFHIIDLDKTLERLTEAMKYLQEKAKDGDIIIVGTKRQARDVVKEEAVRCGAHFVVNRWVGGQLTNFDTVKKGIKRLRDVEEKLGGDLGEYTQQELSVLRREWGRLNRLFGGVKTLDKLPDVIVAIDAYYERIAIKEAKVAGVPIVALVDSNTDPSGIDYPVPANDDAVKSVQLFTKCFADAILAGNKGKGVKHEFKDFERVGIKEVSSEVKDVEEKKAESKKKEKSKRKEKTAKTEVPEKKEISKKRVTKKTKKDTKVKREVKKTTRKSTKSKTRAKPKTKRKSSTKSRAKTKTKPKVKKKTSTRKGRRTKKK